MENLSEQKLIIWRNGLKLKAKVSHFCSLLLKVAQSPSWEGLAYAYGCNQGTICILLLRIWIVKCSQVRRRWSWSQARSWAGRWLTLQCGNFCSNSTYNIHRVLVFSILKYLFCWPPSTPVFTAIRRVRAACFYNYLMIGFLFASDPSSFFCPAVQQSLWWFSIWYICIFDPKATY